jgi:hypothetical protein
VPRRGRFRSAIPEPMLAAHRCLLVSLWFTADSYQEHSHRQHQGRRGVKNGKVESLASRARGGRSANGAQAGPHRRRTARSSRAHDPLARDIGRCESFRVSRPRLLETAARRTWRRKRSRIDTTRARVAAARPAFPGTRRRRTGQGGRVIPMRRVADFSLHAECKMPKSILYAKREIPSVPIFDCEGGLREHDRTCGFYRPSR